MIAETRLTPQSESARLDAAADHAIADRGGTSSSKVGFGQRQLRRMVVLKNSDDPV